MTDPAADLVIRPMTAADLPRVLKIAASLENAPRYPATTWERFLDPQSIPLRLSLVAADASGNLHGFVMASLLPPQAEIETIAVAVSSQRRGIARRLLQSLLLELAGICEVWLEVRVSNAPAIALYRSFGFRETGRRPRYYDEPVEDALLMSLQRG